MWARRCRRVPALPYDGGAAPYAARAGADSAFHALPAQKRGMRTLPRLVYDAKVVREYLKHRTWTLGLALGAPRPRLVRRAAARALRARAALTS